MEKKVEELESSIGNTGSEEPTFDTVIVSGKLFGLVEAQYRYGFNPSIAFFYKNGTQTDITPLSSIEAYQIHNYFNNGYKVLLCTDISADNSSPRGEFMQVVADTVDGTIALYQEYMEIADTPMCIIHPVIIFDSDTTWG